MKRILIALLFMVLFVAFGNPAFAQQPTGTNVGAFTASFAAPYVSGVGTAFANFSAGTIYKGGTAVSIVAGSATVSANTSKSNCDAPAFSSCVILYWTSSTTLLATTSITTATSGTNIPVAYMTTDGSGNVVAIVPVSLDLPAPPIPVSDCSTSATCATVTFATGPLKVVTGTVAFSSATTAGVSGLPAVFASGTSFAVVVSNANGHAYTSGVEVTSATAFTIISGTSNSDTWTWVAFGHYLSPDHDGHYGVTHRGYFAKPEPKVAF